MATTTTTTGTGMSGQIVKAEAIKAYLEIGDDTLARWIAEGMPHAWTGTEPGCGHRLFHLGLVDEWLAGRMRAVAKLPAPTAPRRRGRKGKRGDGSGSGSGPVRTERGYEGF